MVSLRGSIGIIGIAMILSLSHGVNQYIEDMEEKNHVRVSAADYEDHNEYDVFECRYDDKSEIIIRYRWKG